MEAKQEKVVYNITLTDESNEEITIDRFRANVTKSFNNFPQSSSSMAEMRRKRCWGLSSCCDRQRTDSAQMMISGKSDEPQTKCQKCKGCMCAPFELMCRPFKRRKMDGKMEKKKKVKFSFWDRICCCSGCCRRCTKKGREERMKKVSGWAHARSFQVYARFRLRGVYLCVCKLVCISGAGFDLML